jgi:hypothetical protein
VRQSRILQCGGAAEPYSSTWGSRAVFLDEDNDFLSFFLSFFLSPSFPYHKDEDGDEDGDDGPPGVENTAETIPPMPCGRFEPFSSFNCRYSNISLARDIVVVVYTSSYSL